MPHVPMWWRTVQLGSLVERPGWYTFVIQSSTYLRAEGEGGGLEVWRGGAGGSRGSVVARGGGEAAAVCAGQSGQRDSAGARVVRLGARQFLKTRG